ncbi:DUF4440 domain-containing protein [Microbacterium thalassium]|uniref:DUF4440 domain-containing protein n=1 Tax=Microbacterium thalassium TaxID=362649 RepID=A0A7X0KVM8_9MICO|nr:DUF4440 domain-containing protein [Microbacterium thalassium]MBB6392358.1 hypothetical protein [Microbacterium thalassium]GLK23569.1 hypothetical protein GCM10017607_08870 [Microbacterium thalassium]
MSIDDVSDEVVREQLRAREPLFHRVELGTSREWFEHETDDEFWEVGASGAVYDREQVWAMLEPRYAEGADDPWSITDFAVRRVDAVVYLATYVLHQGPRVTRRATLWRRTDTGWRILYHQGTEAPSTRM